MTSFSYAPVVELTRGHIVESLHFGAIAVSDASGNLLAGYGDPDTVTFLRSSAKPFQALPFVERGGDTFFGLTSRELAFICASHSGTDEHVAVARDIQAKVGVTEADLLCGVHPPYHEPTARALECRGEAPTPNRHNCSGKHTGMLAHARLRNLPIVEYIRLDHPVQVSILSAFAEMCGLHEDQVEIGIDGCSAPTFAVPLRNAALAFARLCDPARLPPERAAACQRITAAMTGNPFMVAGPGRFDTRLMELASGRILSKAGAEGYLGVGVMPEALGPGTPALGIAFKISDGDLGNRARACTAIEILRQLGAISQAEAEALSEFDHHPINNWRHIPVGEMRTCFELSTLDTD
ncbi:MAG: asparaginase [Anaerolineaceae bacterium]|nr:asparaginase [Anaerolineaceae bacterium]